jgi:hypothetical protein
MRGANFLLAFAMSSRALAHAPVPQDPTINGSLVTIPFCQEVHPSQVPQLPPNTHVAHLDGASCAVDGRETCLEDYSVFPNADLPSGTYDVNWNNQVSIKNVMRENCYCGISQNCGATPTHTFEINPQDPLGNLVRHEIVKLLEIDGEIKNKTDSLVRGEVIYWANYHGNVLNKVERITDLSLYLSLQILQGSQWVNLVSRQLQVCNNVNDTDPSCTFRSVTLEATVPASSQVRMILTPSSTETGWGYAHLRISDASLFGAQCFASPNPHDPMCQ